MWHLIICVGIYVILLISESNSLIYSIIPVRYRNYKALKLIFY